MFNTTSKNTEKLSEDLTKETQEGALDTQERVEDVYTDTVELEENYKPPGQLYIPEEAKQHFEAKGLDFHWIRIIEPGSNGDLDYKNIQQKETDGYQFVKRSEVPGLGNKVKSYFAEKLDESGHGLYVVGDLALAVVSKARKAQKRNYVDKLTHERSRSVIADLRKNSVMPSQERNEGWNISKGGREVDFEK